MKELRKDSGVTLVVLSITIIILIILAGISMNVTLGDNGILTKVQQTKENIEIVQLEEGIKLNQLYIQMDSIIDEDINFSKNKFTKEFNFKSFTWGSDMTFEIDSNILKVDGNFSTGNGGKFSIYGYKKSDNAEVILLDTNPSKTDNVNKTLNTNINVSNYSAIRFAIGPATFEGTISLSGEENIDSSENKLIKEFGFQPFTWGSNTTFEIDSNILNINGNFSTSNAGSLYIYGYQKTDNTMVTLLDTNPSKTGNVNENINKNIDVSNYNALKISIGPATFKGTISVSDT